MAYEVTTIGDLPSRTVGTDPRTAPPAPVPDTFSAPLVAAVAIGGVLVGALGFWAWGKWIG